MKPDLPQPLLPPSDLPAMRELMERPQWVAWRLKDVTRADGTVKQTKPPVNPKIGGGASHSDPNTWGTYGQARVFAISRKMAGIGFVLTDDDGYTGIDLDKCRNPETGELDPWAAEIVALAETYTEISPSRTGIRMIARGKVEATVKCDPAHVEIYRSQRYLTITGNHVEGTPTSIEPAPKTLAALLARVAEHQPKDEPAAPAPDAEPAKPARDLKFVRRERTAERRKPPAAKGDFWKNLRDATMNDVTWFRDLFPAAKFQPGTGGWRVQSKYLGRNNEEDISITPGAANGGIVDFGVHDMGDKKLGKRTAVDLVMEWGGAETPEAAARWLCDRIGLTMESLGWTGRSADGPDGDGDPAQTARSKSERDLGVDPRVEAPRALYRSLPSALEYPVDALGEILGAAAHAIVDRVQCPAALAAQSVLGVASLALQGHADVEIPATGHAKPLSLDLLSIAPSGDRKSAADAEALWPVREREKALRQTFNIELKEYLNARKAWEAASKKATGGQKDDYRAIKSKLDGLGDEPAPPLMPMLTCPEPTFEGLCKLLADGQPSMGIFSDEGGSFIAGHGMSPDNRLRTVAGLSSIWDGSPIKRVRVLDGSSIIDGKRVAMHLMVQPEAAARLLSDPVLKDQGFLSRLLVAAPDSTAGTRFQRDPCPSSAKALNRYNKRMLAVLERPPRMAPDTRNELEPRILTFARDAAQTWRDYADEVERRLASGGPFEPIRGFANKLPEHAARVAGVLTLIDDLDAPSISSSTFVRAMLIANYHAGEALRLFETGHANPELIRAELLRKWLLREWDEPLVSVRAIARLGPNSIRDTATAKAAIKILVDHGWLVHVGRAQVEGRPVREAWSIIQNFDE